MTEICINYRTVNPVVYNAGTQWESQCSEFLAWLAWSEDSARAEVERLNSDKEYRETRCRARGVRNVENIAEFFYTVEEARFTI